MELKSGVPRVPAAALRTAYLEALAAVMIEIV